MSLALICLGVFLAGIATGDLIRFAQRRGETVRIYRSADLACRMWSADPANWCERPDCSRCWGGTS